MRVKRTLSRILLMLLGGVVILIAILLIRTFTHDASQISPEAPKSFTVAATDAATRLGRTIQHRTLSYPTHDQAAFEALHADLLKMFPGAHRALTRQVVNGASLLYTWEGRDPKAPAILLLAHLDVVPVEPGTEKDWREPPFSGVLKNGYVWGRGAMDFKVGATAMLEAIEGLTAQGFIPARTVLLGFGHDEEVGGANGARKIAEILTKRGIKLALVLDEGLVIVHRGIPGLNAPVALIGLAEKGFVSLKLEARSAGGHSSSPGRTTAAGRIGRAVHRLEADPFPPRLTEPMARFFDTLGPHLPFMTKLAAANRWLLEGAIVGKLASQAGTDALVRTTTAVTMLAGSPKDNVLPQIASAVVNFRILPGDTIAHVIARVKSVIDDNEITVTPFGAFSSDPSPVSSARSKPYRLVETTIRQIFPDALVAPSLMIAATDARHFQGLSNAIYRFSPQRMWPRDRARFHGTNERQSIKGYADMVRFYAQVLRNLPALAE